MEIRPVVLGVVLLLAGGIADAAPPAGVFSVRDYGARGDRQANDRAAIQAAVDACRKAGGGTVVLPPGDYLSSTIRLGDHVTLRLEKGATLWASTDPADYDTTRHLLVAERADGVAVVGPGTIHGQGTADYGKRWGVPKKPPFRTGILLFTRCRNVTVRDATILYSDAWTLHFRRCENVTVEGVTIRNNYRRLNSDGIDPNSCRHVRIANCRITAGDDGIVLKATEPHPCEDVVVTDCVLESAASAIKLGTESQGDFRNVRFENCTVRNSFTGIGLYLKDGATMERITFRNIRIATCPLTVRTVTPVFVDIERRHADSKVGTIRDVTFEGLTIRSGSGVLVQGMPESPIRGLAFRDVRFRVDQADDYADRRKPVGGHRTTQDERDTRFARLPAYLTFAHVKDLVLEKVQVEIAAEAFDRYERSAVCLRHVDGGRLREVVRRPGPEAGRLPVIAVADCRNVALPDRP